LPLLQAPRCLPLRCLIKQRSKNRVRFNHHGKIF
jgi:hypothetical protein